MKRFVEKFMFRFVWKLPHSLIYYCALRAAANATCGEFGNKTPEEVSIMDMIDAWGKKRGGDKSFRTLMKELEEK